MPHPHPLNVELALHPIPQIIEELRAGHMIVLVDDEHRENEGDLVCAAEHITPEIVNFMLREGRGMLCVSLEGAICDQLELEPQSRVHSAPRGTAYTITVDADARFGTTTGVSAADRARTIAALAHPDTRPEDLNRPGHVQPLRARDGGTLVRAGQTEGSVDLCRLAGLRPAAVIIEIMNDDGTMARRPELERICRKHELKMCSVADVIQYRIAREKLVQRIGSLEMENDCGRFTLTAYHSAVDPLPHVTLTCGDIGKLDATGQPIEIDEPVLVRMHSQNLLGDVFGDLSQPSGKTLQQAMSMIHAERRGAVVYLRHGGTGTGLLKRLQTISPSHVFTPDAATQPNCEALRLGEAHQTPGIKPPHDMKAYGIGCHILRDLGIHRLRLITNHPFTPTALSGYGLTIDEFVPASLEV